MDANAMNVYFRSNASGPWQTVGSNLSVYNGTYRQQSSNMNQYGHHYFWSVNISDSRSWTNTTYLFSTLPDSAPSLISPSPANGSTSVALMPKTNITINDANGDSMTLTWFNNKTGSWVNYGHNNSVGNGTYRQTASWATSYGTRYWWKVCVDDGTMNVTRWYYFTTRPDSPPNVPTNPFPADGAVTVPIHTNLSWTGGDPDQGDIVTYDVYFGTTSTPPKVTANQSGTTYNPGVLTYGTTYYWKIVAWDNHGASTTGPVWNFKTNSLPNVPSNPSPPDHATGVPINTIISWTGGDPDPGDTVLYDVYFGVTNPPPKIISNQTDTSYTPGTLSYGTTYYWRIVSWDNHGASTAGTVWNFKTNTLPNVPSNPNPLNNTTDVSVNTGISWTGGDPDPGDTVLYDVYFGATNPPPKVAHNQSGTTYNPGTLSYGTIYYWKIVAWDIHGARSSGPLWQFTTHLNTPPSAPVINGPSSGKPGISYDYTFVAVDPEGDNISYEINWGDGTTDNWYGPVESNVIITRSHTWKAKGTYTIQARAKDIHGAVGEWGSLIVTMPLTNQFQFLLPFFQFLQHLFERFPHAFPILRHFLGY